MVESKVESEEKRCGGTSVGRIAFSASAYHLTAFWSLSSKSYSSFLQHFLAL
jgi:hypothetical protein